MSIIDEIRAGRKHLSEADLTGADLRGADLTDVNLSRSRGVLWAQAGPVGTDRRTITAAIQDGEPVLHAGCFHETIAEFRDAVEAGGKGWGWPDDCEHLQAECLAALAWIETSLNNQTGAYDV